MKYLVSFFFLIVSSIVWCSQSDIQRFDDITNFGDSITDKIKGKEFLYYITGHHGHIWSLAVSQKSYFIIYSGNTRNSDFHIDTIFKNASILKWGFDSLALYSDKMKPVARSSYWPFYERLVLVSSREGIIFDCVETNSFSGPDSLTFNKNLNELKYFMHWFASPTEIKEMLPTPL